ncbi:MAG TPA: hypothetical protein VHT29_09170 [Solirubrobacteraceae bacterium]|jgi:hypothetical protein|nr:hypothetical protein [Solirubrobacteraceae bacterium]
MSTTTGADALLVLYEILSPEEQEEVFQRIGKKRLQEQGYAETELAKYIRSLRRVAEAIGHVPGVEEYKNVSRVLLSEGESVEPFSRLYAYFGKSWARAQEALELSGETTTKAIEARFQHRRIGKPVRYSEDALRDALARAVQHFGRPPNTAEYSWWRLRQLELARAQGEKHAALPTDGPYRHRWKSWEAALLHFGYTPDEVAHRLERKEQVFFSEADPYLPDDLQVAELADDYAANEPPLTDAETERLREAYEAFPRRTRYILTVRLALGVPKQTLRETAELLALHLSRIQQVQLYALDALVQVAGDGRKKTRPGLRADVVASLRYLSSSRTGMATRRCDDTSAVERPSSLQKVVPTAIRSVTGGL